MFCLVSTYPLDSDLFQWIALCGLRTTGARGEFVKTVELVSVELKKLFVVAIYMQIRIFLPKTSKKVLTIIHNLHNFSIYNNAS